MCNREKKHKTKKSELFGINAIHILYWRYNNTITFNEFMAEPKFERKQYSFSQWIRTRERERGKKNCWADAHSIQSNQMQCVCVIANQKIFVWRQRRRRLILYLIFPTYLSRKISRWFFRLAFDSSAFLLPTFWRFGCLAGWLTDINSMNKPNESVNFLFFIVFIYVRTYMAIEINGEWERVNGEKKSSSIDWKQLTV